MEYIKTIEDLLEIHGEELKEYLLTLPLPERQRVCKELLRAREEMGEPRGDINEDIV